MNTPGGRTLVIGRFLWTFVGPGFADTYPPRHHCRLAREAFEAVELRSTSWARGRHRVVRIQSRINTVADILRVLFRCGYFSLDALRGYSREPKRGGKIAENRL